MLMREIALKQHYEPGKTVTLANFSAVCHAMTSLQAQTQNNVGRMVTSTLTQEENSRDSVCMP